MSRRILPPGPGSAVKIFLSHSSKGDDYASWVRQSLVARLASDEVQVLVDTDEIPLGQEWCAVLYEWLAVCDAAVVLLNHKALESFWVRREINILLWRRALNRSFQVIPALLGEVRSDDLKAAGLDEINPIQIARIDPDTESKADAKKLSAEIAKRLSPQKPARDGMAQWVSFVAERLQQADPQLNRYLCDAARALGMGADEVPKEWITGQGHRLVAAQLLGQGLHDDRLQRAVAALADAYLIKDPFERLAMSVRPCWVDGTAARQMLPPERDPEANRRILIINARRFNVAEQYLARATFSAVTGYESMEATCDGVGAAGAEELAARFDSVIRKKLDAEDEPAGASLPRRPGTKYYLIVQLGGQLLHVAAKAVHAMHGNHPWVIVVLLVGPDRPSEAELASAGLADAAVLSPPLAPDDEVLARQLISWFNELPGRLYGQRG